MKISEGSTRQRILSAAARKFETDGIRGATMNSIASDAGVTKRTLYYHFRSKDDLTSATLKDEQLVDHSEIVSVDRADSRPLEVLVREIFGAIGEQASDIRWKGCAFSRTAAELAGFPGHPAVSAAKEYKSRVESAFLAKFQAMGVDRPHSFARRLMIILDGALTHSLIHHKPEYAMEAGQMALETIDEARALASRGATWHRRVRGSSDRYNLTEQQKISA